MNRPFGAVDVAANLKGAVPKATTQKILVALAEKGELTQKTYGKTTFFVVNQSKLDCLPAEEIATLETELKTVEDENKALAIALRNASAELARLKSSPTNAEINARVAEITNMINQARERLEPLRQGAPPVSSEELAELEKEWTRWRGEWVRRRKLFTEKCAVKKLTQIDWYRFWQLATDVLAPQDAKELAEDLGLEWDSAEHIRRKLVIVGDGTYSWLASSPGAHFLYRFPKEYVPVFDNYVAEIKLDEKPVQLALWDTAGQEEYELTNVIQRLRPMSYAHSHVILIAFALDTPDSLENVTTKWIEEVRELCGPQIPVILVGCKADLRPNAHHPDTPDNPCPWVTREKGERVAQAIGARAYKECSALKIEGVDDVFEAATRASMLMREGVPSHPQAAEARHHRRRSAGKAASDETGKGWKCCVIC
ncbi:GTP-binding protein rho2 [Leucoagaricus sp. SymC.cos]|nr:GTP-binding protein rho2 [Leucoagaricus sp. SymC.cos]